MRSAHPAHQQHCCHCKAPAGPLGRCDPAKLLTFFACFDFICFLPHLFNMTYQLLCPLDDFFLHILPTFYMLDFFGPCPAFPFPSISVFKHFVIFYLAFTKATEMKTCPLWHLAPFLFPLINAFCVWLRLSMGSLWVSLRVSGQLYRTIERSMQFVPHILFLCMCVFVFMKACSVTTWSVSDTERRSGCTECNKQVCLCQVCQCLHFSCAFHAAVTSRRVGLSHSSPLCPSCHGWQALPLLLDSAPK